MSGHVPAQVGVYGGGRMGSGIAHVFLRAGSNVIVVETDEPAASAARRRVRDTLVSAIERESLAQPIDQIMDRLTASADSRTLADVGLVIEAVPEDVQLKMSVLHTIERVAPAADLATNTSSMSINALAVGLARPERFIGLHFFNPVPVSSIVEVVAGARTDANLIENARAWVAALEKDSIIVTDSPGFASSRLGVVLALEAMRMVEAGVASVIDIDKAMTLGYKHAVGPLRTTDIVGLDVRLAIADYLAREIGPQFTPPDILVTKVAAGELGRKTGHGFYDW